MNIIKSLLVVFLLLSASSIGQVVATYSTAGTYYWTAPCDVTSIQVECWGGGGGGGGATGNPSAGGGGSGGAYVKHTAILVDPGTTYTITVGAGGAVSAVAGNPGGVSWFNSAATIQAVGGAGGALASANSSTAAGAAAVTTGNVGGTLNNYGGAGGTGGASGASGGGGGGSAGTGSPGTGNPASGVTGGAAVTGGGAGANGSTSNADGASATTVGGGGAGGRTNNGGDRNGGAGYAGKVVLTYTTSLSYTYCTPTFTSTAEPITNVTFAGINNTTSGTTGGGDYEKFCATGSVVLGSSGNTISVSGNTAGNYTNYLRVYIDWNSDGDFSDSDESFDIGTISNCTSCSASTTITVPCTATVGMTTMRVMKRYSGYPSSACQTGAGYGQAEDYPLIITAEPGSATPTAQPTSLSLSAVSGTQINGSFTASSPAAGNYLVVRTSTSSAPTAPTDGTTYSAGNTLGAGTVVSFGSTTSFSVTGLTSNTQYWFWIYSCNGTCSPKYLTVSPLSDNKTTLNVINWIGLGAGGTGTDFNTASNWSPATVPGITDNANITTTTAATILLSADITIGSLTLLNNATTAITLALDATTRILTINGDLLANVNSATTTSTTVSLRVGNSPGSIIVGGTTTLGNNGNVQGYIGFTGSGAATTTGSVTFKGNTTFSLTYGTLSNYIGTFIWDGTGAQTIYTNSTYSVGLNGSCQIGGTNTPTVTVSSTTTTNLYVNGLTGVGNLTVKAGSTLDLGSKLWNKSTTAPSVAGGTLTLEAGAKLRLAAATGGQTGSNFPLNFTTSTPVLNATSTVEYYGTSDQTIWDAASPGYGHLTLTNSSTKTAGGGLDIQGNLTINSTATFAAGTSLTHNVGGNWSNSGTFSYTTGSTIVFNGASNQSIAGTATTSFNNLTNSNTSTGLTLNRGVLVSGTLNMAGATANILLNGYNIDLSSTGTISGESNTDRIYGTSGVITTTRNLSTILTPLDIAGLGCLLTTPANMGSTVISRGHSGSSGTGLSNNTILRYFVISPTINSGLSATLTVNYFDNELNGLGANESDFKLYRSADGGATWEKKNSVENTGSNSNTLAGIDGFSVWTLSPDIIALPISLIGFDGENVENTKNVLSWTTMTESNNDFFTVERSLDGKVFEQISKMSGAGNSAEIKHYTFDDTDYRNEINYYRLKQTDFDGQFSYSEMISIDNRSVVKTIVKIINLHGQEVDSHYKGVVIIVYTDGTILRTVQNL